MTKLYVQVLTAFRKDERGVTLVEYGIAIALAVGLGTLALTTLATEISSAMTAAGNEMPNP